MDRVNDQPTWLDTNDNFLVLQKYSLYFWGEMASEFMTVYFSVTVY